MFKKEMFGLNVGIKSFFDISKVLPDFNDFNDFNDCKSKTDIIFNITTDVKELNNLHGKEKLNAKTGNLKIFESIVIFKVSNDFDMGIKISEDTIHVTCLFRPKLKRSMALKFPELYRFRSSEFELPEFAVARTFVYRCFYPVLQLALIRNGASFIHGSTIVKDSSSTLLTGWGGSGKTSLSSSILYNDDSYFFQSDDIAIINTNNEAMFNPMVAHIYPYNLVGFPELKTKILSQGSFISKNHWSIKEHLKGMKGVRRRVKPSSIYSIKKEKSQLGRVVFFQRADIEELKIDRVECDKVSKLSVNVILEEITSLMGMITEVGATYINSDINNLAYDFVNLDMEEYCSLQLELYNSALKHSDCYVVTVPLKHGPIELMNDTKELFS